MIEALTVKVKFDALSKLLYNTTVFPCTCDSSRALFASNSYIYVKGSDTVCELNGLAHMHYSRNL